MNSKRTLIADVTFLGLAGTVQMVLEITGHFAGIGRHAERFYQSPYTFWQSFVAFDFVVPGILATLLHLVFIGLNGRQLTRSFTK